MKKSKLNLILDALLLLCIATICSGQASKKKKKNNSNCTNCSLKNEYAADLNGQKSSCI